MSNHELEVELSRLGTTALISEDPFTINIERPQYVSDGKGGQKRSGYAMLMPQTFRIIEEGVPRKNMTVTPDGVERRVDFWLLGQHDADVQDGDTFMHNNRRKLISSVGYDRRWRVVAEVV